MFEAILPRFPMPRSCPYQLPDGYSDLRAQGPLTRVVLGNGDPAWVVTGYAQVRSLLADSAISSDATNPNHPELAQPKGISRPRPEEKERVQTFIEMDEPLHRAHRRMTIPYFSVRRVLALRARIQMVVDELLDGMLGAGPPADLVSVFAVPLPSQILCYVFGIPRYDIAPFQHHARLPVLCKEDAGRAFGVLSAYFYRLLEAKRAKPADDLLTGLDKRINAGELTIEQAVNMCMMLLIAGHETTANTIALGALTLLAHGEQLAIMRGEPALMSRVVEEVLRYLSIADTIPRFATGDIRIAGQTIRAGDGVILSLAAANRDAAAFSYADRFDVRRTERHHVAFSYGVHQCLGQNLARSELEIVFSTLFRRVPTLRLATDVDQVPVKPAVGLQGVSELLVTW